MEGVEVAGRPAVVAAPTADGVSKAQRAYAFLRERIEDGTYSPGYRLVLGQIARELNVSPVPVREAVRLLEAEGLVSYERNVGAQVAMPDPDLYVHTMDTLGLVEGYATALALPTITPERIAEARAINEQLARTLDAFDPATFTRLNAEFHETLFQGCPNPHVLDLVQRGWRRLHAMRVSTFGFVPGRAAASVAEHEHLLDLIEQGADATEVESAARLHRHNTLNAFLAAHHRPGPASRTPLAPVAASDDHQFANN